MAKGSRKRTIGKKSPRKPRRKTAAISVAIRLKKLREVSGLSQTDIAQRVQTQQSTISRWEAGVSTPVGLYLTALNNLFDEWQVPA